MIGGLMFVYVFKITDKSNKRNEKLQKVFSDSTTDRATGLKNRSVLESLFDNKDFNNEDMQLVLVKINDYREISEYLGSDVSLDVVKQMANLLKKESLREDCLIR
jgi:GGDEF domain-containing protein